MTDSICMVCEGKGSQPCPHCKGKGKTSLLGFMARECPLCKGTGKEECTSCHGTGTSRKRRKGRGTTTRNAAAAKTEAKPKQVKVPKFVPEPPPADPEELPTLDNLRGLDNDPIEEPDPEEAQTIT